MRIDHRTELQHPVQDVLTWHERPGALVRLTPPGIARIADPEAGGLDVGRRTRVLLGPPALPGPAHLTWELRHAERDDVGEGDEAVHRFVDQQVTGPFRAWRHEHTMSGAGAGRSVLEDHLDVELPAATDLAGSLSRGRAEWTARRSIGQMLAFRSAQLHDDLAFHARHARAPRLTVAIAGASGLIGTQLTALLRTGGHTVLRMVRGREAGPGEIAWDPQRGLLDPADLEGVDAVVNLAGRPISSRFTPRTEQEMLSSRTSTGELIARTLAGMSDGPRVLLQASAIGYYGADRPGEQLTEDAAPGDDVLAQVCRAWEASSRPAIDAGVRVVHLRTGIVLSDGGGALLPQIPLFLAGAGGRLAARGAMISWITLDDMVRAYAHALLSDELSGPVNAVGPQPVSSAEFARTLGRVLHRPALIPTPAFGPALVLGREGARELVRADQDVDASRLLGSGFAPEYPELEEALRHVLHRGA
ncbi:TIGR01777 family protein [Brachybacterium endophyticum]|uniref:TIGR01777 family protein n=1 Tax=Brachybacterium endophyticum TaxID=2182385 RepID=A0A2U2RKA2_9MICO|nr:TIGR01777 family oxidoreductase [Brachybacterium endophyticum]PWH06297.1 TIGR01777 family protein [Brachybacterium endophyticum]